MNHLELLPIIRQHLDTLSPGDVLKSERTTTLRLLARIWERLPGATRESTAAYKLQRAENLRWEAPLLSFTLERHGQTVYGSSRASLHRWTVNVESGETTLDPSRIRQLYRMAKRFDANAAAKEIRSLFAENREDPRLRRLSDGTVQVLMSKVAPSSTMQTQSGRNERLRSALNQELRAIGWEPLPGIRCRFKPVVT